MSAAAPSILLADDDEVGRYVIATMLRRAGFHVVEVNNGLDAVAQAQTAQFDLALLDVKMPGLDGFEACRRIKSGEDTRHLPVLMLSATFMETEAQVEGLETGADAYLTQPVEAPVLAATIRSLLRSRSLEQEVRVAATEWRTTFDAISDAVAVLDADGTVLRANPAFQAAFGDAVGSRLEALEVGRESGELQLGDRTHSVRVDRVPGSQRLVVTLSDVTAARRTERERAEALARERAISRTLQQTLLPERLPSDERLGLHAWHLAAEQELIIGGDWYDVIETRDGVWLVIGDVAGHGVAAAAQAGQLRHSLRVYAHEGFGLAESVFRLNELVTGTELTDMATMCVLALTHDTEEVRVVSAGHPPPVLIPREGPARLAMDGHSVVLGVIGAVYEEFTFTFAAGDRLLLYTDGLVERPGELIDEGMTKLVGACAGVPGLEALRAHVVDRLVGDIHPRDDVALLLAERCVD